MGREIDSQEVQPKPSISNNNLSTVDLQKENEELLKFSKDVSKTYEKILQEKSALEKEHSTLSSKVNELELEVKKLARSKEVVEPCKKCDVITKEVDSLKSNVSRLQDEALNFSKLKKSSVVLDDMLIRQKLSQDKEGLRFSKNYKTTSLVGFLQLHCRFYCGNGTAKNRATVSADYITLHWPVPLRKNEGSSRIVLDTLTKSPESQKGTTMSLEELKHTKTYIPQISREKYIPKYLKLIIRDLETRTIHEGRTIPQGFIQHSNFKTMFSDVHLQCLYDVDEDIHPRFLLEHSSYIHQGRQEQCGIPIDELWRYPSLMRKCIYFWYGQYHESMQNGKLLLQLSL
ncbi:hypothetical protein Tco_0995590 [Tanacetum coccineum]